ncbi:DNA polymerase IV [Lachnospiraceae bacterium oral taxon 500]|nr:DNA polymerase IV [Lachnospiraceae bacterium oral taxon 500]
MDAFYAAVEIRDNPALRGKALIIGALPHERGVVATCSYEARKYGVRSAMNIKEAHRLCPEGIYLHPNFEKYRAVSARLHSIWNEYAEAAEYIALDEAYLDVTKTAGNWEQACAFAKTIKSRILTELGLTCSIGVAYSKAAAKTASEEKKPNGYFEIPSAEDFVNLVMDRDVRVLYTVGAKTAEKLNKAGIYTIRHIRQKPDETIRLLGKQGRLLTKLAMGIDERRVVPYKPEDAKSISREFTFQADVNDFAFLRDALLLLAISVERRAEKVGLYGESATLKITYADMKTITRSKAIDATRSAGEIYKCSSELLEQIKPGPVRLIGVGIHRLTREQNRQLRLEDLFADEKSGQDIINDALISLRQRYGLDFAGNLDRIFTGEIFARTMEYMRKHR